MVKIAASRADAVAHPCFEEDNESDPLAGKSCPGCDVALLEAVDDARADVRYTKIVSWPCRVEVFNHVF